VGVVTTLIILALVFLLTSYLRRRRTARPAEAVSGAKVLVCSLGRETAEGFEDADAKVYSAYYRHVDVAKGQPPEDFLDSLGGNGYDILHLFCELDEDGDLVGGQGRTLNADTFFEACRKADVKLLFIASENSNQSYIGLGRRQPRGLALDMIRTIGREGENFTYFLGELLGRMSAGKTMALAWVEIAPQIPGARHEKLPAIYCSVGRGAVLLP
jgi:hypothetical protein